jgi:molybdate transport system permease protein
VKGDRLRGERWLIAAAGGLLGLFLALPLTALVLTTTRAELASGLRDPLVWPALRLSLLTTTTSLCITVALGTPLAWTLARARGRVARGLEVLFQLPVVIPPAVAGVALLLAFGRRGLLAGWLYPVEWAAPFTTAAVVMAEVFVAAPFYVQAATSAFRRLDENLLTVARTFGASPARVLLRVALPLATRSLVAGAAMSWARALGEFGATLMFAGNLQGRTQTLPLAIYAALEGDLHAARALSVVLVVVALALLLFVRAVMREAGR